MAKAKDITTDDTGEINLDIDALLTQKEEAEAKAREAEAKALEAEARIRETEAKAKADLEKANQNNLALLEELEKKQASPQNSQPVVNTNWPSWLVIPIGSVAESHGLTREVIPHACDESDALRLYYKSKGVESHLYNATVQRVERKQEATSDAVV